MTKIDSFRCDGCGKMRENDTNRWWKLYQLKHAESLKPVGLAVLAFDADMPVRMNDRVGGTITLDGLHSDLCGESCLSAAIQSELEKH